MLVPSKNMRELLDERSKAYADQMTITGVEYLKERGITKEVAAFFRIGLVDQPFPGDDPFKGRISIPYLTPSGCVAIKYRAIDGSKPKYKTSVGATMKRIFNPGVLSEPHLTIYVCEGEFDTITASMCGLPAVGIPGAKSWDKKWARAFRNRRVIVLADGDDNGEGKEFGARVLADIDDGGMILFDGEDVNSYYCKYGKSGLLERVGQVD